MNKVDKTEIADIRHPQLRNKPEHASPRKPDWIRVKAPTSKQYGETRRLMRNLKLHTVCEEAACPNIGECWQQKHATVMILGDICHPPLCLLQCRDGQAGTGGSFRAE